MKLLIEIKEIVLKVSRHNIYIFVGRKNICAISEGKEGDTVGFGGY